MIYAVLAYVAMSCAPPQLVNKSTEHWNAFDAQTLKRARFKCSFAYRDKPCLVRLTKLAPRTYRAICGRRKMP